MHHEILLVGSSFMVLLLCCCCFGCCCHHSGWYSHGIPILLYRKNILSCIGTFATIKNHVHYVLCCLFQNQNSLYDDIIIMFCSIMYVLSLVYFIPNIFADPIVLLPLLSSTFCIAFFVVVVVVLCCIDVYFWLSCIILWFCTIPLYFSVLLS